MTNVLVKFGWPTASIFDFSSNSFVTYPSPFESKWLTLLYEMLMPVSTPLTIGVIYFASVHFANVVVRRRQEAASGKQTERMKAAPYAIAMTRAFKIFVLLHNIFLCAYSVWTFIGFTSSLRETMQVFRGKYLLHMLSSPRVRRFDVFFETVCDTRRGIFSQVFGPEETPLRNLEVYGWWFYISKYYEVVDTIIILLKGKPSLLLQSYHHTGAMMCMWAGIRFHSLPIWIFVAFNLFIHSWMYFYYSLCCLHIRVPNSFKKMLTSMQITQFLVGGLLAVVHLFVRYVDTLVRDNLQWLNCVSLPAEAMSLMVNVVYLAPLTALFALFYVESYMKRSSVARMRA